MNPNDPFSQPTPNPPNPPTQPWQPQAGATWPPTPSQPLGWAAASVPVTPAPAPAAWPTARAAEVPAFEASGGASSSRGSSSGGRRSLGAVAGTALVAALVASVSTAALVEVALPRTTATTPASASTTAANPGSNGSTSIQQEDITGVVANVRDSVVTLTSEISTGRGGGFFGGGTATGIGTGIVLTADGYALTNRHVVEGSQSLKATMADGTEYPANVVKISDTQDLALVKIDATGLKPATIGNSDAIQVGQTAIAIGSPLGTFTETVTKGIVSALDRSIQVQDEQTGRPVTLSGLIQTDAAINPGNSGGPLLNAAGEVVGVNTATAATAEGIGFAIPIKEAQSLIDQARTAAAA